MSQDGLCDVITVKNNKNPTPTSEQSEKARQGQCVFLPRPFPSNYKREKKKKPGRIPGLMQSCPGSVEPGELPGKLAGNQAGLRWKPACVSAEVHPNRYVSAKHFAYDKSAFADKNLFCWKAPSQCLLWHHCSSNK